MLNFGFKLFLTMILLNSAAAFSLPSADGKSSFKKTTAKKVEEPKSDWSGSASYSTSTNLAATGEKRRYSHSLSIGVSYAITKNVGASLGAGVSWKAEGQNIRKENENPSWDDISLGIGYSDKFSDDISYSLGMGTGFPTSYESNLEEIKGTLNVNSGLSLNFWEKRIGWSNSLSLTRYFQTYDYSIVSGELNAESNLSYTTNVSYRFGGGFSTSVGFSTWSTKLTNGEVSNGISFKSSSGISLGYSYKNWSFSAGYSVGNYDDTDGYQLMLYDEQKRSVRLGVGVEF